MTTTSLNPTIADAGTLSKPALGPRRVALIALALSLAAVQFSIAIGQIFFGISLVAWIVTLGQERRRPTAPPWMLPLLLYAAWTLLSAAFSPDRATSFADCKQLVLLLLVPLVYDLVDEDSAMVLTTLLLTAAAISALVGIGQYSIFHYDNLGQRPRSTLGLYMTFSGLMMLALILALSRVLFMTHSRLWPALVIPAITRRACAHPVAQRLGGGVLWRRSVADDAGPPAHRRAARRRRRGPRGRAADGPPTRVLHVQPAGPHGQRPVRDDPGRQPTSSRRIRFSGPGRT